MADSSPVLSNNGGNSSNSTPTRSSTGVNSPGTVPTIGMQRSEPMKNQRGLNKPKCIKCGNVARSRCPYQSCKNCCAKAQNPCHIHVLKPNATLADRGASTNSNAQLTPPPPPSETPPSGPSTKVTSLRQLSSTFAQYNNVHAPLRTKRHLTVKEALAINSWRFAKLKEYKESNIEAENEAFDRYMKNISLLEEVFDVNAEKVDEKTSEEETDMITEVRVSLRSNPVRVDKFRRRIQQTIEEGLSKLEKHGDNNSSDPIDNNSTDELNLVPPSKVAKTWWASKTSALMELNERLNKARNEDDLKQCIELRSKIRGQQQANSTVKTEITEIEREEIGLTDVASTLVSDASFLTLVRSHQVDQGVLNSMDSHFSSLEEIEDL